MNAAQYVIALFLQSSSSGGDIRAAAVVGIVWAAIFVVFPLASHHMPDGGGRHGVEARLKFFALWGTVTVLAAVGVIRIFVF
ncbi:MAG: hypothetical protein IIC86_05845 [Chloroflexi bacterium]|nr:hypothetical protein [Chloroflexota bacterium]